MSRTFVKRHLHFRFQSQPTWKFTVNTQSGTEAFARSSSSAENASKEVETKTKSKKRKKNWTPERKSFDHSKNKFGGGVVEIKKFRGSPTSHICSQSRTPLKLLSIINKSNQYKYQYKARIRMVHGTLLWYCIYQIRYHTSSAVYSVPRRCKLTTTVHNSHYF